MNLNDLKNDKNYHDLFDKNLNISYLTLGGSKAYGTNTPQSDTDIRGFFLETKQDLLGLNELKEEYVFPNTDTVVYSFGKFVKLLIACNPNMIELIGTRDSDIIYESDLSQEVRNNAFRFLSKKCFYSFAGYATAQLRRLENALARDSYTEIEKERHIMKSIEGQFLAERMPEGIHHDSFQFSLHDDEIHVSVELNDVPLKTLLNTQSAISNTIKNFGKLNHRNHKKDELHLNKHAMHLIRLYLMAIEILEKQEIHTYRDKDHDLLMSIRNGEVPYPDIFKLQQELETKLHKAYQNTKLPEHPDMNWINNFVYEMRNKYAE
mgnify:CR=1 FL=1